MAKQYIGARYTILPDGDYDPSKQYEPLTLVNYGSASYISKKIVPQGVTPIDTNYWMYFGSVSQGIGEIEVWRETIVDPFINDASQHFTALDAVVNNLGTTVSDVQTKLTNHDTEFINIYGNFAISQPNTAASRNFNAGEFMVIDGILYVAKTQIISGEPFVINGNIEPKNVGEEISSLNNDLSNIQWTNLGNNIQYAFVRKIVMLNLTGTISNVTAGWLNLGTLPNGLKPSIDILFPVFLGDSSVVRGQALTTGVVRVACTAISAATNVRGSCVLLAA